MNSLMFGAIYGVVIGVATLILSLALSDESKFQDYLSGIVAGTFFGIVGYFVHSTFGMPAAVVAGLIMFVIFMLFIYVIDVVT